MINAHITEYANFAYFDLELHDLDLDPRSYDCNHVLPLPCRLILKKERTQYLYVYLGCGRKWQKSYFHDLDLQNVHIDPKINRLPL